MRAVWITKHGGRGVLQVRETPDPLLGEGEIRIRVKACGLNFAEVTARQGLYPDAPKPPCVVGYEGAGIVEALGPGVASSEYGDCEVGSRVLYLSLFGGHADVVTVPARNVFRIPDSMSFEEAAALPVNYLTAHHILFEIRRIKAGEHVLIHAAAGGVGTALLQLCKTVPDVVTYGTCSAGKHDYVREQGCDHPIDYRHTDYPPEIMRLTDGRGVDLIIDSLGGPDWRRGFQLLRQAGMLVACGVANINKGQKRHLFHVLSTLVFSSRFSPLKLMDTNRAVAGLNMGHLWNEPGLMRGQMESVLRYHQQGKIKPHVFETFPFDRAADAHAALEERLNTGKVLLIPPGNDATRSTASEKSERDRDSISP